MTMNPPALSVSLVLLFCGSIFADPAQDSGNGRLNLLAEKIRQQSTLKVVYLRCGAAPAEDAKWLTDSDLIKQWKEGGCQVEFAFQSLPSISRIERTADLLLLDVTQHPIEVAEFETLIREVWSATPTTAIVLIEPAEPADSALLKTAQHYDVHVIDVARQIARITISGVLRADEIYDDEAGLTPEGWRVYGSILSETLGKQLRDCRGSQIPDLPVALNR